MAIHTAEAHITYGYRYFEVKKLTDSSHVPTKDLNDAGWDLYANEDVQLWPEETKLISTGIAMSLPKGFVGLIWDRSSMGVKGIHRHAGVIDSSYRGEVKVCLHNTSGDLHKIKRGDRIAQLLIQEIPIFRIHEVEELDSTKRGSGGFGSTGK
tara:strand:+ start:8763 stop:9221 length:459 start_codon:yes stop_codon:yes gene_type:complete